MLQLLDATCGLAIQQMLPNEGSDLGGNSRKPAELSIHGLGDCRGISLSPRGPSITPARDCAAAMVSGPSERPLKGPGGCPSCMLVCTASFIQPVPIEPLLSFRHYSRCWGYSNEQNQTRTFPLRTSSLMISESLF